MLSLQKLSTHFLYDYNQFSYNSISSYFTLKTTLFNYINILSYTSLIYNIKFQYIQRAKARNIARNDITPGFLNIAIHQKSLHLLNYFFCPPLINNIIALFIFLCYCILPHHSGGILKGCHCLYH